MEHSPDCKGPNFAWTNIRKEWECPACDEIIAERFKLDKAIETMLINGGIDLDRRSDATYTFYQAVSALPFKTA